MSAKYRVPAATAILTALFLSACGSSEPPAPRQSAADAAAEPEPATDELPARIALNSPGLLPEGVEYDTRNNRFLVGSLSKGTIFIVERDGALKPFIEDPELKSSVGIEVDEERNRLLVANSDSAVFQGGAGQAKLGIYALDSGERIAMIDLTTVGPKEAKAHFANDVTVSADGSVYVTDSQARVIYKVDPSSDLSIAVPNKFGKVERHMLNGIVAHPQGYLLVAETFEGALYKVPLDKPESFTRVKLPEPIPGADGMVLHPNGNLIVVRNDASNSVVALSSTDDWATATIAATGTFDGQATTAAIANEAVYVVHPFFNDPNAMPFIERVELR